MAVFNEILVGRFARGAQKLFGIKGNVPTPTLSADIVVNHQLHSGAERMWLEGWDLFTGNAGMTAFAAQQSSMEVRNPTGSGVIVVLTRAQICDASGTTTATLFLNRGTAVDQSTVSPGLNIDQRSRRGSSAVFSNSAAGASTNPGGTQSALARWNATTSAGATATGELLRANDELPLLPGDAFWFVAITVNIGWNGVMWWRERPLEDSEKQ
jgi:hypothetical protein